MSKKKKKQKQAETAPVEEPVVEADEVTLTDAEAKAAAYGESLRAEGTLAFYRSLKALRADDIAPVSAEKDRSARLKKRCSSAFSSFCWGSSSMPPGRRSTTW